jgi:glycosyltransferase involved in cell wall biosynthesis
LYHSPVYARAFRAVVTAAELVRTYQPGHRLAALALVDGRRWARLPRASKPDPGYGLEDFPAGTVIIPAHNEAAVIGRTLESLAPLAASGRIEVIVACNGCTDGTADIARGFAGVRVLEVSAASKTEALNASDESASLWPRLYLDADIEITPQTLWLLFERLAQPDALSARPSFRYDTAGAAALVKIYYRARNRMPSLTSHLWGAGAYALSKRGHARFTKFPAVTADDVFVDSLFSPTEKDILATQPVIVRTPRTARALLRTLRRVYRGNAEQGTGGSRSASVTLSELFQSIRGPLSIFDAAVYVLFAIAGRRHPARGTLAPGAGLWERDDSSRAPM